MQIPRQLVNLIGALVVVAALAAGMLLVALPAYLGSTNISAEADRVASDNGIYRSQADDLLAEQERFDSISAEVDALREQIPATPLSDEIFQLVSAAAAASGVVVREVSLDPSVAWVPQVGPLAVAEDGELLSADAAPESPGGESPGTDASSPTDASAETDGASGTVDATAGATATEPGAPVTAPQQSIAFTILVDSPTPQTTSTFLDALKAGPRLLAVVHALQVTEPGEPSKLTVNALTFIRTES